MLWARRWLYSSECQSTRSYSYIGTSKAFLYTSVVIGRKIGAFVRCTALDTELVVPQCGGGVYLTTVASKNRKKVQRVRRKMNKDYMSDLRRNSRDWGDAVVVFVATEVAPWSKVGGLADVIGALPRALLREGGASRACVMSVTPMYEAYEGLEKSDEFVLPQYGVSGMEDSNVAELYECLDDGGVTRVFIKHPLLDINQDVSENERSSGESSASWTYVEGDGGVYGCRHMDVKYDILAWGALTAASKVASSNEDKNSSSRKRDVVFVLNDWPSALHVLRLQNMLRSPYSQLTDIEQGIVDRLGNVKTVFCIHNLAYQGIFSGKQIMESLLLPPDSLHILLSSGENKLQNLLLEDSESPDAGTVNFMKTGLVLSDQIVTVSPHYAQEIMSENRDFNCGLGDVLRDRGVVGIMNGIDVEEWNPVADKYLPIDGRFSLETASSGKSTMKKHLQSRLGLHVDENAVLFVFIGRLTQQKGVDVLLRALSKVIPPKLPPKPTHLSDDYLSIFPEVDEESTPRIQVVMLGTGDHWMEKSVESLEYNFPGSAKGICAFSEEMAHWMIAAADYALVPSAFEPCGLIAQCAAHYGAVPIMTSTGGLKNLGDSGVGILVPRSDEMSDNVQNLRDYITAAADVWGSDAYDKWQKAAMQHDVSWDTSAKQWRHLLTKVLYDDK